MTNYYSLLEIAQTASADEIKRAFRQQIALYHPDKVQHLGKEFQAMAAERAAALTEAYRILSNERQRAEYDKSLTDATTPADASAQAGPSGASPGTAAASGPAAGQSPHSQESRTAPRDEPAPASQQFSAEKMRRDTFVRKATMSRFQQALDAVASDYDRAEAVGFDVACVPRSKLFARNKNPRLLGRFVSCVDGPAVVEAWTRAGQWTGADDACVFLMGSSLASAGELAKAIAEQRKKSTRGKLTLIPVDARDWDAHMPVDAPGIAKTLLARLRSGG